MLGKQAPEAKLVGPRMRCSMEMCEVGVWNSTTWRQLIVSSGERDDLGYMNTWQEKGDGERKEKKHAYCTVQCFDHYLFLLGQDRTEQCILFVSAGQAEVVQEERNLEYCVRKFRSLGWPFLKRSGRVC